jgi:hypothetical protein
VAAIGIAAIPLNEMREAAAQSNAAKTEQVNA